MDDNQQAIEQLTKLKRELTAKLDKLMRPVRDLERQLGSVSETLALLLRGVSPSEEETCGFPLYRLRGKTQAEALFEVAEYNGGIIESRELRTILVAAKLMRNTPNVSAMVNLLINRSGAFEKIGRGVYQLIESRKKRDAEQAFETSLPPSKPVQ